MIQQVEQPSNLLQFLKKRFPGSNREIKKRLEQGLCRVNGKIERFGSAKIKPSDRVIFDFRVIQESCKEPSIICENENYYVLDKPTNLECSEKILQSYFPNSLLVHRLDKQTSGVFLLAKNKSSQKALSDLFRKREVKKTYLAYVDKIVYENQGEISSYFIRKGFYQGQTLWGSDLSKKGLFAQTSWVLVEKREDYSVLRCYPKSGRTHQIRVHLKEMGHPILGDFHYCRDFTSQFELNRLYLHSEEISFHCPLKLEDVTFFSKPSF